MKTVRLKKPIKIKKSTIFIFVLFLIFICVGYFFSYLNTRGARTIMHYATMESKKISSIIINDAIDKNVTSDLDINELFIVDREDDNIKSIDFNTLAVNKFLTKATKSIQDDLKLIENGDVEKLNISLKSLENYDKANLKQGIICEVRSGVIFNNVFLSNLGPKIPVKLSLIGNVTSKISTEVKNYGINNALIQVYIDLKVDEQVLIPFSKKNITIDTKIPIALKMITGIVPKYYVNGFSKDSQTLVVPADD